MFRLPYHVTYVFLFIGLFAFNLSGSSAEFPQFHVTKPGKKIEGWMEDEGWRKATIEDVEKWDNYLKKFGQSLRTTTTLVVKGRMYIKDPPTTTSPPTTVPYSWRPASYPNTGVPYSLRPATYPNTGAPSTRRPTTKPSKQDSSDGNSNRWILQNSNLCFGPETGKYGLLTMTTEGILKGMKFVHNSGTIVCKTGSRPPSYWGCGQNMVSVVVTDHKKTVIMPDYVGRSGWYDLPGYTSQNKTLVLIDDKKRTYTFKGQVVKVYSSYNHFSWTKTGQVCAEVYAMFD